MHEMLDDAEVTDSYASGNKKSDIQVQNTGNVPAYLRVRLVSYFVDAEGSISGAEPSVYPEITLNSGWLAGENHTYYYTKPVEPNGLTPRIVRAFYAFGKKHPERRGRVYRVSGCGSICRSDSGSARLSGGGQLGCDGDGWDDHSSGITVPRQALFGCGAKAAFRLLRLYCPSPPPCKGRR